MKSKISIRKVPKELREEYTFLVHTSKKIEEDLKSLGLKREEILKNAVKEIDIEKEKLLLKLNKIERAIDVLCPPEMEIYNQDAGWKEKVIWVLKKANRLR